MSSVSGGDVRKDFLLATIANYFGIPLRHDSVARLAESPKLNNFLDDGNASLLSANLDPGEDIFTPIYIMHDPPIYEYQIQLPPKALEL